MLQAITVSYKGPTNVKGPRMVARASAGKVIVPYDHAFNVAKNATIAARLLQAKYNWDGNYIGGVTADGNYVFVAL